MMTCQSRIFLNTQSIIERKKLISIFSTHSFFRIEETTGLFHNEVIRGVVAIYLKKIKLKYFISCCKDAQEICLERIGKVQRSECWVAEYLFQVFQKFSSEYKNIEDSMNIDEFKKNILPEHLSSALNRYINRENKDIENTEVDAFNLIEKINKDEELRFIINYSLCKEGKIYNENSFKEIIQYIRDFFF